MTTTACTSNCIYVKLSVKWCHCSLWKVSCIRNIWQTSLFSSQRMINWSMQSEVPGVKRRWDEDIVILLTCVCLYCPYLLYYYKLITDTMFVTGPLSPQLLRHCIRWPDVASGDGDHGQVCCWSQGGAGPGPCYQQHHFLIFYQLVSQLSHNNLSPVMITQLKIFSKTLTVQLILILWNAL